MEVVGGQEEEDKMIQLEGWPLSRQVQLSSKAGDGQLWTAP